MRGHGQSTTKCSDYSAEALIKDANCVLKAVLTGEDAEVFLIGHSLGASILAALPDKFDELSKVKFSGLVMIDIIEETAVQALSRMPNVIAEIPKSFKDINSALKWTLSSSHSHHTANPQINRLEAIEMSLASQLKFNEESGEFEWITDLSKMSSYWDSWFVGLTANFLKFPGSRLLILASDTEFMDRDMTIAQMQGKFQLVIVRDSGHAVQEDQPDKISEPLVTMIQKHLKLSQILRNK